MNHKSSSPVVRSTLFACLCLIAVGCAASKKDSGGTSTTTDTSTTASGQGGIISSTGGSGQGGIISGGGGVGGNGVIDGGLVSKADAGAACGDPGFACCAGNSCNGGGCCVAGICMGEGGTCATLGGGACAAGACGACGGLGFACCTSTSGGSNATCTAPNTICTGGTCERCGAVGYSCCASGVGGAGVCEPNTLCGANNKCVACGIPGAPCCPGDTCSGGCCYANTCVAENGACGSNAGTCQAGRCSGCGNASQPCCSKDTCYGGLLCKSGTCNPCGSSGEACCPASSTSGQCKAGLACVGNGAEAVCARCGGAGDYCCAGRTCSSGCCSLTTNRCVADTSACGSLDGGAGGDGPMSQCATGGSPCSALAHFTGTQVLDGKDDEFCAIPSFELTFPSAAKVNEYNGAGGPYRERAVARVGWDATGIHAFIRVYDSTFTPAQAADSLWNGDGVELMFSSSKDVTGLTSSDANTLHVMISPPNAASVKDYSSSGTPTPLPAANFVTGSDTTGYWVELNLPWPGPAPTASAQIKFDMQLNAADGVSKNGDGQIRDAQAVYYQAAAPASSPCGSTVYPFCDDRVWCTTTLQP